MHKKKTYLAVSKVRDFIRRLPDEAQAEYLKIVRTLETDGYLVEPYGKKLDSEIFEIRIRRGGQVRILYFYYDEDIIYGVHGFVKKTQKAPKQEIKQARRVISKIKRGDYNE